ncbi:hypothetical protein [Bradyrhizobium sp. ARR65]|uniref:hypothetical protein n=1 Tax=Bradyrhizobium sp. ARR65 TaxID=1040989 RepID=UPI0012FCD01D|nr:hypothetical protein [Bradyrhizobium sp. ARR65]
MLEAKFPGEIERASANSLSSQLCASRTPAIVVADVASINNILADSIHSAESKGISIGVVPFEPRYTESLWRLIGRSVAVAQSESVIGLYSSRGLRYDYREPEHAPPGRFIRLSRKFDDKGRRLPSDASYQITSYDFTALAVITEGRQTYCLIGMGCLHPTISEPEIGRLAPSDIKAKHWLIQSCHSPFMWPELGSYLTVPLSIALTSDAETVICSTHVQTYIPNLLNVFVEQLSRGCAMGDILRTLNNHAASEGVDHRPFLLLGNPESNAIAPAPSAVQIPALARPSLSQTKVRTKLVRRLIANVEFLFDEGHFGFDMKDNYLFEFRRDMAWLPRLDMRTLSNFLGSTEDVGVFLDGIRPPNVTVPLIRATGHLSRAFERQGGFYRVGEQLDENYSATGASQTKDRCVVCGEHLIQRRLDYFGQSPSEEYATRSIKLCPRCLVVEHASPIHRASTQLRAERALDEMLITLSYTNNSPEPQWVFVFAFLSDPNNISRSTAPQAYKDLLRTIKFRRGQERPRSLEPGQTYNFSFRTGPIPTEFWYLLIEVNLLVDFCWNWYSFTYRAKQIEGWLSDPRYRPTLPPRNEN